MTLPPKLEGELEELRSDYVFEVIEDPDFINLIFKDFALGEGYSLTHSELLLRMPRSYPDAGPDMFWTAVEVLLAGGTVPQAADSIEPYAGKNWRRFSWHRPPWNPNVDNLHGHIEFIRRRLREKK
jgi:hypothetical protein